MHHRNPITGKIEDFIVKTGIILTTLLKQIAFSGAIALLLAAQPAHADEIHRVLEKRIESLLPEKAEWALVAIDMESGENIAEFGNSLGEQLIPASLTKLLTTGAVLDHVDRGGAVETMVTVGTKSVRKGKRMVKRSVRRPVAIRDQGQILTLLRDMNVHSRNTTAQNLADFLGERHFGPPGSRVKGARAVCDFLNGFDLPTGEAVIADGCGLKRENRVTARFMARYLHQVAEKPWFGTFRETLPRPGFEGTVKRIGYTDQRFRVKTGSLNDVFALAGYGVDLRGKDFSFAFIVNVKNRRTSDHKHSRGEIMRLLAAGALQQDLIVGDLVSSSTDWH